MKKVLKYLLYIISTLILIIIIAAVYVNFSPIPSYKNEAIDIAIDITPQRVEQGLKITSMLCKNCHQGKNSGKLDGKVMEDLDPRFGVAFAPNITADNKFGAGRYTDGELIYLLRTGIKKDGQYSPPWMPKFPHMADEDIASIVAFLRSNHPLVAASDKVQPASKPSFLAKFLSRIAFKPLPYPTNPIPRPDTANSVEHGRYLSVALIDCFGCHSENFENMNSMEPEKSLGYFGGGNPFPVPGGEVIISANITPDKETGIGNWTKTEFINALKYGKRPDGIPFRYPMEPIPILEDKEAGDIYEYLRTIPAINNRVERNFDK